LPAEKKIKKIKPQTVRMAKKKVLFIDARNCMTNAATNSIQQIQKRMAQLKKKKFLQK
jgi:hypothetical protein